MNESNLGTEKRGEGKHLSHRNIANFIQRFALLGVWVITIVIFGALRPETFLSIQNFSIIFGSQAVLVVLTMALLIPLTAGDYDMSAASVLMLSNMTIAVLNVQLHVPIGWAIVAAITAGFVVGFVNGAFVILLDIDPFIVTLGTGSVINGVVLWISNSTTIGGISQKLVKLVVVDKFLRIPLAFYYGLAICIILWYVSEFTSIGKKVLYVGRGRNVARLSGIRVNYIRWSCLVASSMLSAFAGVLYAGTTGGADPASGLSFLLPAFAAAFLGSTTIIPGRFNPWGSFISVYFLVTGITGLTIMGIRTFVQNLFYGGALVLAVAFSQIVKNRSKKN